jgi:hypothetical protein
MKLRTHLNALASQEGFVLGSEPVFTISTVCAGCENGDPQNMLERSKGRDNSKQPVMPTPIDTRPHRAGKHD